jgi:hypothetical protein
MVDKFYDNLLDYFDGERDRVKGTAHHKKWIGMRPSESFAFNRIMKGRQPFVNLLHNKQHIPRWYNDTTDYFTFFRESIKGLSVEQMREKVEAEGGDPYNAFRTIVFRRIVNACKNQATTSHRRTLPKISKKIREYKMFMYVKGCVEELLKHNSRKWASMRRDLYTDAARENLPKIYAAMKRNFPRMQFIQVHMDRLKKDDRAEYKKMKARLDDEKDPFGSLRRVYHSLRTRYAKAS